MADLCAYVQDFSSLPYLISVSGICFVMQKHRIICKFTLQILIPITRPQLFNSQDLDLYVSGVVQFDFFRVSFRMSQREEDRFSAKRIAKVHLVPTKLSSCINGQGKHPDWNLSANFFVSELQ
jgi:hypothetical protein